MECLPSCCSSDQWPHLVLASKDGPGWQSTWKKWLQSPQCPPQGACTCVGEMCCLYTSTPVSLKLFVLLGCAVHGMTHGSRRDGGLPSERGGFRWFTGLIEAIREFTCHHRSCVRQQRGCLVREKSNLGKCCSIHINLSIHYYYDDENLLKVLV